MSSFYLKFLSVCVVVTAAVPRSAHSQCVAITNLPDTVRACRQTSVQLSPTITVGAGGNILSTLWVPTTGLSNANIPNPIAAVGLTSQTYRLTVQAAGPTLTTNGNFSAGATGFTTGYATASGGASGPLSTEGQYIVTFNANLAHTGFANFTDHTGGGQMMVLNGATTANTDVWCQTLTVTPNTDYVFSGWGASAVGQSPASLQFSANGTPVGPAVGLPLAPGVWTPFGGIWNSGAATSLTVCISNANLDANGNDFAIDDIQVQPFCIAEDSVRIHVVDPQATFTTAIRWGCTEDTVDFTATPIGTDIPTDYLWDFGDGATSTQQNPTHIYAAQGVYTVKLVTTSAPCSDSTLQQINLEHPLVASFTQSADSFCQGGVVSFDASGSVTTIRNGIPPRYFWDFGDGGTDSVVSPTHVFTQTGVWPVILTITDFVPCQDLASGVVVIDSVPFVRVILTDSVLCVGEAVSLRADYLTINSTGLGWDFGDGVSAASTDSGALVQVQHGYDLPGTYTVSLTASYRICPDTTVSRQVEIRPYPALNIGPDTSLCPGGEPLVLRARGFGGGDGPAVRWSTGDTASRILVRREGTYWALADAGGCTVADSVVVRRDCYLDVPNVFTPNGDGNNDYFWPRQLLSEGITAFRMTVYNRWGVKVWETTALEGRGWDGRYNGEAQPAGVYIYRIEAELKNSYREKYEGNVTLMR